MTEPKKRPKGVLPPHIFCLSSCLIILLGYLETGKAITFNWGGYIVVFAFLLVMWAARQFKKAETTIYPGRDADKLVTTGPFAYSRNPMYLGMLLALCGFWVGTAAFLPGCMAAAFPVIIQKHFIRNEETSLERLFGQNYLIYKSKVRRWL